MLKESTIKFQQQILTLNRLKLIELRKIRQLKVTKLKLLQENMRSEKLYRMQKLHYLREKYKIKERLVHHHMMRAKQNALTPTDHAVEFVV